MREAQYTARLRKELRQYIYCLKLNNAYSNGLPDCWYSGAVADLWTEHKKLDVLPPTINVPKLLSPLQALWLAGRHAEGRKVGVIVFSPGAHLLLPGLTWQDPVSRDEFRRRAHNNYKSLAEEIIGMLGALKDKPLP
jgi:hypothetical protein